MSEQISTGASHEVVQKSLLAQIEKEALEARPQDEMGREGVAQALTQSAASIVKTQLESLKAHEKTDRTDLPGLVEQTRRLIFEATVKHVVNVTGSKKETAEAYVRAVFGEGK